MLSSTHAFYANRVYEYILNKYNVKLKKSALIYSSTHPKVSSALKHEEHDILKSLDRVSDLIEFVVDTMDSKEELEKKDFARELGAVLHFIADYFCRTHNKIKGDKPYTKRQKKKYEKKLDKFIKKCNLYVLDDEIKRDIKYDASRIEMFSFRDYIAYTHSKYVIEAGKKYLTYADRMKKESDTVYSYQMVLLTSAYVVERVIGRRMITDGK